MKPDNQDFWIYIFKQSIHTFKLLQTFYIYGTYITVIRP